MLEYISPTDQNIAQAFFDDVIQRKKYLAIFCGQIVKMQEATSLALDGRWGTGKTFFVKQAKLIMDAFNPFISQDDEELERVKKSIAPLVDTGTFESNPMYTVYYDAWENDDAADPLLSLIYSIAESIQSKAYLSENVSFKGLIEDVLNVTTGRSAGSLLQHLTPEKYIAQEEKQANLKDAIHQFLDDLPNERGNRVNIIIDELDRCSPAYAIKMLERIKHYFTHDRLTFIFALNTHSLEKTVRHYYGNDMEGTRYLDRFFDIRMAIPPVSDEKYLHQLNFGDVAIGTVLARDIIKKLDMSLREALRYSSQYRMACSNSYSDFGITIWKTFYLPIAIAYQLTDMDRFQKFMSGNGTQELLFLYQNETVKKKLIEAFKRRIPANQIIPDEDEWVKKCAEAYYAELLQGDYYASYHKEVEGIVITERCRLYAYESVGLFDFVSITRR